MSETFETILAAARTLPPDQQHLLARQLLTEAGRAGEGTIAEQAAWLAIVEETRGTIKGLDRETLIWLAADKELCEY